MERDADARPRRHLAVRPRHHASRGDGDLRHRYAHPHTAHTASRANWRTHLSAADTVEVQIFDPANSRWEVPEVFVPRPDECFTGNAQIAFTFIENPFSFAIARGVSFHLRALHLSDLSTQ